MRGVEITLSRLRLFRRPRGAKRSGIPGCRSNYLLLSKVLGFAAPEGVVSECDSPDGVLAEGLTALTEALRELLAVEAQAAALLMRGEGIGDHPHQVRGCRSMCHDSPMGALDDALESQRAEAARSDFVAGFLAAAARAYIDEGRPPVWGDGRPTWSEIMNTFPGFTHYTR